MLCDASPLCIGSVTTRDVHACCHSMVAMYCCKHDIQLCIWNGVATCQRCFLIVQFLRFYDNWVARDAEGTIFRRSYNNVASDAYGTQRMHQGMAFPVTCCWNGLAVFDAAPLQESGLQFRCVVMPLCCAVCAVVCYSLMGLMLQCNGVLCCTVMCCAVLCFAVPRDVLVCSAVLYCALLCIAAPCDALVCCAVLCCAALCCEMLIVSCHTALCCDMSCCGL